MDELLMDRDTIQKLSRYGIIMCYARHTTGRYGTSGEEEGKTAA